MKIERVNKSNYKEKMDFILKRNDKSFDEIDKKVQDIIANVREKGDSALYEYTKMFDKVELKSLKVEKAEIDKAIKTVSPEFIEILKRAKENIENFHKNQMERTWMEYKENNVMLGQLVRPIERAGIYVPGGTAAYPSTVLMDAVPAKVAGVEKIIMTTPPDSEGNVNPNILAAAYVAGVDEVYKVGGAQAIAALAYGTESIECVDKIVGPGNIYVARAKKCVFGKVAIDMIAGPSEVCIIADKSANPKYIAADLLAQAEHDVLASSILITDDENIAKISEEEVKRQMATLSRNEIMNESINNQSCIFVTEDINTAFDLANYLAPEHLELLLESPMESMGKVKNAGAIFLGENSPEPLGDYFAGPNHTLPTSGTARFSSPLGVYDFLKKSSIIYYSKEALSKVSEDIMTFAKKEGLDAHANSINVRFLND